MYMCSEYVYNDVAAIWNLINGNDKRREQTNREFISLFPAAHEF